MYAELHALSNFSFLRGASQPEELVEQAKRLGYCALALTDECSLAGVVRAHVAAKKQGLPLIIGTELTCIDGLKLVALATDRASYGAMSRLISRARRAHVKGRYALARADLEDALDGCLIIWLPHAGRGSAQRPDEDGRWLRERFQGRLWIGVELLTSGFDMRRLETLEALGKTLQLPSVAAGDVHMHRRSRRALQDVLTAIRLGKPLQAAGYAVFPNGERCLRPVQRLRELYPAPLLAQTLKIAERCTFSLEELRYEYPEEIVPAGATPASHLHALTMRGCAQRWPAGVPPAVRANIEHELRLIAELKFEPFFLTVHDVVQFARSQGILCQGRGSAANSTVCYCLGITEVDPSRMAMLFERFISKERNEPPDIDVDFEHERREEVIQYIYGKYGRERAALAATVICYRPRSALRDVGKALGLDLAQVDKLARGMQWWDGQRIDPDRIRASGFDPEDPVIARLIALAAEILGFPRHLSQHVGGFVIARGRLDELVPIENAAMPDRTVIEWDKDDLDALGLLKVDVLGLGMLSALRRTFQMVNEFGGSSGGRGSTGTGDGAGRRSRPCTTMICRADTTGVFQIESRAQMSMLPRLRPQNYYDLVIEVAIVRPGPIQGEMVHPYLRRRSGEEAVTYPSKEVEAVLKRTLGVPIFQEQVMQLAIVAAGLFAGRGGPAAPRHGGLEAQGRPGAFPAPIDRRHARARIPRELRASDIQSDTGIWRIWLSGISQRQLRAAGLYLRLAQTLRTCGILRGAHQQPADGLLCAGPIGARCALPWRGGARRRCGIQRLGLHARAAGRWPPCIAPGAAFGQAFVERGSGAAARGASACVLSTPSRIWPSGAALPARSAGHGGCRCVEPPCGTSASRHVASDRRGTRAAVAARRDSACGRHPAAARAARGPGHRRRLWQHRPDAAAPSAVPVAGKTAAARRAADPGSLGAAEREMGENGGPGHHASAAGQRRGSHLRHHGG